VVTIVGYNRFNISISNFDLNMEYLVVTPQPVDKELVNYYLMVLDSGHTPQFFLTTLLGMLKHCEESGDVDYVEKIDKIIDIVYNTSGGD
jgi:hypothetical protein